MKPDDREQKQAANSELRAIAIGIWLGTIGSGLVAGKLAQEIFGYSDLTGITLWMLLATVFFVHAFNKTP